MKHTIILISSLFLTACEVGFQDTSGAAYLAANQFDDPAIANTAAYEPDLHFPAQIGVVKLVYGQISATSDAERAVFAETMSRVPGNIVQLGPLEARMSGVSQYRVDLDDIRHLAASRHLDYVLIISYLPGKNSAEALFIDVQNGYPYASIENIASGHGRRNFWGGNLRDQNRINAATLRLARNLVSDMNTMVDGLIARASGTRSN